MASQPTCGKGLAEHSVLPAKLGEWTAAVAENLARLQTRVEQDRRMLSAMSGKS
jgi:hypothetical protein